MARRRCPICRQAFESTAAGASGAFCSKRCREIDLGRWLDEAYGLPERKQNAEDDEDAGPRGAAPAGEDDDS